MTSRHRRANIASTALERHGLHIRSTAADNSAVMTGSAFPTPFSGGNNVFGGGTSDSGVHRNYAPCGQHVVSSYSNLLLSHAATGHSGGSFFRCRMGARRRACASMAGTLTSDMRRWRLGLSRSTG